MLVVAQHPLPLRQTGATSEALPIFLSDKFGPVLALNAFLYIPVGDDYSSHITGNFDSCFD